MWLRAHSPIELSKIPPQHTSATIQSLIDRGYLENPTGAVTDWQLSDAGFDVYWKNIDKSKVAAEDFGGSDTRTLRALHDTRPMEGSEGP